MVTRLVFATDLHGSEKCWRKFISAAAFKKADVLILGGDLTGKLIIPIATLPDGKFKSFLSEQPTILANEEELAEHEKYIRYSGYYPYRANETEIEQLKNDKQKLETLFNSLMTETFREWLHWADERLKDTNVKVFLAPGNDDRFDIDQAFKDSTRVTNAEGQVIPIDDYHEMISTGWSNPTPWNTYREEPEDKLYQRINDMVKKVKDIQNSIFVLHSPPYDSDIDEAPELDKNMTPIDGGQQLIHVGSTAVRDIIMEKQPLLGLHGHIHEARGASTLSRTLCINPGSEYSEGILDGVVVELEKNKVKKWVRFSG